LIIEVLGYPPCPLCLYQRLPYYFLLTIGLVAFPLNAALKLGQMAWISIGSIAVLTLCLSTALGIFHAGVEFNLWQGPTGCSGAIQAANIEQLLETLKNKVAVSCKEPNILILGLSLSVWNTIVSVFMLAVMYQGLRNSINQRTI
jgi:disulfide bond formation protein DsbB